jgi:hypothetical protein
MQTKEWNNTKEILEQYPISSTTYKKRIKNIDSYKQNSLLPKQLSQPDRCSGGNFFFLNVASG